MKVKERALLLELERRLKASQSNKWFLKPEPSPLQQQILESPHRFKILRAGRRGGKSWLCMYKMVLTALSAPRMPILYIALTRDSAQAIMWDILKDFLTDNNIPFRYFDSRLRIVFRNGSTIQLVGADLKRAQDRLRGRFFKLVIADEVAFSTDADNMISVLLPSVSDYEGSIWMASSPGDPVGYFYEADQSPDKAANWEHWAFTMKDNPFYAGRWEQEMKLACDLKFGGDWNHPMFRQEYFADWIHSSSNLLFPYTEERNLICKYIDAYGREQWDIPKDVNNTIFGLDFGITDKTVLVVGQYSDYRREFYIVDCAVWDHIVPEEFAVELQKWMLKYPPHRIVADCGGLGKVYSEALTRIYRLPIEATDKLEKAAYIKILASDLYSGFVKVKPGLPLLDQWSRLLKDPDTGIEKNGQVCDLADAALYAHRFAYTYTFSKMQPKLDEEERMFQHAVQSLESDRYEEFLYG